MRGITSGFLALGAAALALGGGAWAYVHGLWHGSSGRVAAAQECALAPAAKENPNKTLFISCSGFLE